MSQSSLNYDDDVTTSTCTSGAVDDDDDDIPKVHVIAGVLPSSPDNKTDQIEAAIATEHKETKFLTLIELLAEEKWLEDAIRQRIQVIRRRHIQHREGLIYYINTHAVINH
jgi:hypothetical protein